MLALDHTEIIMPLALTGSEKYLNTKMYGHSLYW